MNLTDAFLQFTLLGAEWVLWLLVVLSVVSVAIMVERWRFFSARRIDVNELISDARKALTSGDSAAAVKKYADGRSMAAEVARNALAEAQRGPDAVAEAMNSTKVRARGEYERNLVFLGTLGNNAPFIGLFGTVLGIIQAFNDLALDPQGDATVVMDGISEALVATAIGLLVAIPAVVAFNFFNRQVRGAVTATDGVAHAILGELHAREEAS